MIGENEDTGEIRQIILITDKKSDIGISPVEAAQKANKAGIVVSTIGIIKEDSDDKRDIEELESIARAGGGTCEYTYLEKMVMTMQITMQKTEQMTIAQMINRQLKSIVGVDINNLEPRSQYKIADFIEKFGDGINLSCVIVLDTSGSMKNKLETAKKSILELMQNLKTRRGHSEIAVIKYPGLNNEYASIICSFTDSEEFLMERMSLLKTGDGTPTGAAIKKACQLIIESKSDELKKNPQYIETQSNIKGSQ